MGASALSSLFTPEMMASLGPMLGGGMPTQDGMVFSPETGTMMPVGQTRPGADAMIDNGVIPFITSSNAPESKGPMTPQDQATLDALGGLLNGGAPPHGTLTPTPPSVNAGTLEQALPTGGINAGGLEGALGSISGAPAPNSGIVAEPGPTTGPSPGLIGGGNPVGGTTPTPPPPAGAPPPGGVPAPNNTTTAPVPTASSPPASPTPNPASPQPEAPVQGSFQNTPSASQDVLTTLFNQASGVDTTQLDETLAAIQANTTRQAATQAANTASSALGQGAAGTPVSQMANDAVAGVLSQSEALQNQTALDFLTSARGQNMQGLNAAGQLALGGENQAFNQGLASQDQIFELVNMLFGAGANQRGVDQAQMDALYNEFLRMQQTNPDAINQLVALMGGTPISQSTPMVPDLATPGMLIGMGAGELLAGGGSPQGNVTPGVTSYDANGNLVINQPGY